MGLEILTLGSSKTYTKESLLGAGAVVGKNVTISLSILLMVEIGLHFRTL